MTYLIRYFIHKPIAANLLSLTIVLMGLLAFKHLKRQATPLVDMQQMRIISTVPAASPKDIELNVTTKLEEALEGVSGIEKILSNSTESVSTIEVYIDPDASDSEKVKSDIRRAVESVQDLPEEMLEKPHIFEIKVEEMIIYELGIAFNEYDPKRIAEVSRQLKRELQGLSEVATVRESAVPEREIKIYLNAHKLDQYQVSIEEVYQSITNNKIRLSGGVLKKGDQEKSIITLAEFDDPYEVQDIVIRSTSTGQHIFVKDVARIVDGFTKDDRILRFNGMRGASLLVTKKSAADIINLVEKIEDIKNRMQKRGPPDLHLVTTWDFSIATRTRLDIVSMNFALGFFLVLIVLFLFLDPRIAFWTALGIPISIAAALAVAPLLDISINSVSLCGVILVLGMIVDDAIIVAESIYKNLENNMKPKDAALNGVISVIKPVFGTIITSIIAFIPLYFLPGTIGDFSIEVPSIVCIVLAASFLEATFILPSHLSHRASHTLHFIPPGNHLIRFLESRYRKLLSLCIRFKYTTFICFIVGISTCFYIGKSYAKFRMFDLEQAYRIYFMGEVKEGTTLNYTTDQVKKLEQLVAMLPKDVVQSFKTTIGTEGSFKGLRVQSHTSFLSELVLTPFNHRTLTASFIAKELVRGVQETGIPFTKFDVEIDAEGPPVGRPIEIRIVGDNAETRERIVNELMEFLKKLPLEMVASDITKGKQELQLRPDFRKLSASGLSTSQIANTIRTIFDGTIVGQFQTSIESSDYRLLMDPNYQNFDDPLIGIAVRNSFGNLIPLKGLVTEEQGSSVKRILRFNGHPSNLITANLNTQATIPEISPIIQRKLHDLEVKFPGYHLHLEGEAKQSQEFIQQIILLLSITIVTIYFWLVFQLESLTKPFMVVLAIPCGIAGIFLAFIGHGMDLSLLALVGIVGVGGVLINDSLILVEFVNRLQRSSQNKFEDDIIDGSVHRFRPIILTTLTTVIGLFPTAYGMVGGTDSFISPLVFTMTWGLLVGTPSVLFIIPVLYAIISKKTSSS